MVVAVWKRRGEVMEWQPIETLPIGRPALVCVTFNVPGSINDTRPPTGTLDYVWETEYWVDWKVADGCGWAICPGLIHIPFPPTHWMPLPAPPESA